LVLRLGLELGREEETLAVFKPNGGGWMAVKLNWAYKYGTWWMMPQREA
jgi:hypothetical protein